VRRASVSWCVSVCLRACGRLVTLLTIRPTTGAQDTAAGALANLARTSALREEIADANGVAPLVALFESGNADAKAQAAIALRTLVLSNEANQTSISHGLVRMLASGTPEAQEQVNSRVPITSARGPRTSPIPDPRAL
jgi:hypothetical protein